MVRRFSAKIRKRVGQGSACVPIAEKSMSPAEDAEFYR
jgi:hypothetical protein